MPATVTAMKNRRPTWIVILLGVALLGMAGVLIWLVITDPNRAQAVGAVLGTGFTAFAAFSAWRAAQVSRAATLDTLRAERRTLQAELSRLDANTARDTQWHGVESSYSPGSARAAELAANLAEYDARRHQIYARLAEIGDALED